MKPNRTVQEDIESYITKDGSRITELMHPALHAVMSQSLAEANIPAGVATHLHLHKTSEEIYHVVSGNGLMTLGEENISISAGNTVCIAPGTSHCVENTGTEDLIILCSCSPAYSHEDTVLLELD